MLNIFDDLALFVKIVECGGQSKAAHEFNLYPSLISRRMANLENELCVQLFQNNTKEMKLTNDGILAYNSFRIKIHNLYENLDIFNQQKGKLCGKVKLLLAPLMAHKFINHKMANFVMQNPDLELDITYAVKNEHELNATMFDFAISRVKSSKPYLYQKVILKSKVNMYTSRDYVKNYGIPKTFDDLKQHKIIIFSYTDKKNTLTATHDITGKETNIIINHPHIYHDSVYAALDLLESNAGIVMVVESVMNDFKHPKDIIRVFPKYNFGEFQYYLIQNKTESSPKYELVKNFLQSCFTT